MHALTIQHRILFSNLPEIHAKRLASLLAAVEAVVSGSRLTLSDLGRGLPGAVAVKHNIKRIDRLLGNSALHTELPRLCEVLIRQCLEGMPMPLIVIDWSDLTPDRKWQLLRGRQAIPFDNTMVPGFGSEPGSNYGACVETWAPAQFVWSMWNTSNTASQFLSGTSMAAPHVAALAARHGGTQTSPAERENYIRAKVFSTGYSDSSGIGITVPSYTQPPSFTIPSRLAVSSATASSTYPGTSPAYVYDRLYLSGVWNSGTPAPAWIELDLGAVKTLRAIRMTPEQFPAGSVTQQIYVGNNPAPTWLAATVATPNSANLEPITVSVTATGRYVRILTTSSPAWVAWREIEVLGF